MYFIYLKCAVRTEWYRVTNDRIKANPPLVCIERDFWVLGIRDLVASLNYLLSQLLPLTLQR
jgi:hypothetical protein